MWSDAEWSSGVTWMFGYGACRTFAAEMSEMFWEASIVCLIQES